MQQVASRTPATGRGPSGGHCSPTQGPPARPPQVRGRSLVCRAGAGASRSWGAHFGWGLHVRGFWGARTPSRSAEPGLLGRPSRAAPGFLDNPHILALRLLLRPRCLGGPQREVPLLPTVEGGAAPFVQLPGDTAGALLAGREAGGGRREASGGGRCPGAHCDLRPVSVYEWFPRPLSPVARPQPSDWSWRLVQGRWR